MQIVIENVRDKPFHLVQFQLLDQLLLLFYQGELRCCQKHKLVIKINVEQDVT